MLITDVFESMRATAAWYDRATLNMTGRATYPFVSRASENNGIVATCPRQVKDPEPGNAITIGLDTQTIAYQPAPFYTSQNIQVLRHDRLDVDSGLVLVTLIRKQMSKFGWGGNGATLGRLRKTRIMVPVETGADADRKVVVDWEGMSSFGSFLRAEAERSIDAVLGNPDELAGQQ
ncbi:MAG: restriction endonuclease subunit S [Gammaproteobacteria bacterium]|nr:restriction endonuclease subunit S [Gammaproteobacteria bacterium]MBU3998716.1 restriction endonuclease subunit S [Gammaproteobacteria bacterium]MBU4017947.1 restriction endonuclease subunit S [Gammaproteobacteria bacterium]MBU4080363.1 restriction endonuclease subunit S [Gammaproteobacteria bacterium]MBU4112969.1 restriction endonuclease subunit S [Gammaproteobacteria bacterium]